MKIETILTPAELPGLAQLDLRETACVVFDILRATSTFVTALHHGATAIVPVSEIPEAIALRKRQPEVLLAGERDGLKIRTAKADGIDFDFGNSPREFTAEMVCGKTIVSTTTNGTRALRACAGAKCVLAAAFLNLAATVEFLQEKNFAEILLVCAGTGAGVALEDVLAAGAMVQMLSVRASAQHTLSDSAQIAWKTFSNRKLDLTKDLSAAIGDSQNGRRLLAIPDLRGDVTFCAQWDIFDLVAELGADGWLRQIRA